jgi:outer membrane biogenesis lipoprotein LolB
MTKMQSLLVVVSTMLMESAPGFAWRLQTSVYPPASKLATSPLHHGRPSFAASNGMRVVRACESSASAGSAAAEQLAQQLMGLQIPMQVRSS